MRTQTQTHTHERQERGNKRRALIQFKSNEKQEIKMQTDQWRRRRRKTDQEHHMRENKD